MSFGRVRSTFEIRARNPVMPKKDRARIDYMPGYAALDALELAAAMFTLHLLVCKTCHNCAKATNDRRGLSRRIDDPTKG